MSKEKTLMEKATIALKALFSDVDKSTIEKFKAELEEAVTPPATPVEPNKVKTKEGVEMIVEGGLVEGSKISLVNPENGETAPAMDGEYELEPDGTKISVTGGLITKVEKKEAAPANPMPETDMAAKMSAQAKDFEVKLNEAVKPLNATIESQAKVIEGLKEQQKFVLSKLEAIANTPIITEQETPEKPWDEMTALEKRRALKNK